MQRRKKKRRLKPAFKLAAVGIVLLGFGLILTGLLKTEKPQVLPVFIPNAPSMLEVNPVATPTLAPFSYTPNEDEVEGLAQMLWGEARGIPSDMEKAACVWCVLNRVDDESGVWPNTVTEVLAQKNQFAGYSADYPATDELKALAADVMTRWQREKVEGGNVGRVLPADYFFFTGDGRNNHFRAAYRDTTIWDWSLPNPYEN